MKRRLMRTFVTFAAALMLAVCGIGCNKGGDVDPGFVDDGGQYAITMYTMINTSAAPKDLSVVNEKLNDMLKTKLPNTTVKIIPYIYSEYSGKINQKVANFESFDLMWCDFTSYPLFLEMDALYPIGDIIDRYAADLKAVFKPEMWDQVRYTDGNIYAIMNNQILPRGFGVNMIDKENYTDYLTAKSLTQADVINKPFKEKLDLIEDYILWIRANRASASQSAGGYTYGMEIPYVLECLGFDTLGSPMNIPGVVRADAAGKPTVINQYETEEFKEIISRLGKWYRDGLIPADIGQSTYNEANLDVMPVRTYGPGAVSSIVSGGRTRNMETFQFGAMNYLQTYIMGTMWGVSQTSKNPARAVKFVSLMHLDPEIHNLLKLGIEGEHYNVKTESSIKVAEQTEKAARYNLASANWTFGNTFIGLPLSTQQPDIYVQHKKINDETPLTPVIGFRFDRTSVLTDMQIISAIVDTALSSSGYGKAQASNAEFYNEFIAQIKPKADIIIAEKQRQLDAWLAAKG